MAVHDLTATVQAIILLHHNWLYFRGEAGVSGEENSTPYNYVSSWTHTYACLG